MTTTITGAVPAFSLEAVIDRVKEDCRRGWDGVLRRSSFVLGPEVGQFEEAFGRYAEADSCVCTANGTDALTLVLRAMGVGPGDEVIVPAFGFFATAEAVLLVGAKPVFADILPDTLNVDLADASEQVTDRTVGLIGVHLFGRPFDVPRAMELTQRVGIWLVEDSAQAHGATVRGRKVGALGSAGTWSFYPSKNLGCFGDGGAITTNDSDLAARVRLIGNHGQTQRAVHSVLGVNSRLDSVQAVVLSARLRWLEGENDERRRYADIYRKQLTGVGDLRIPVDAAETRAVYHQFVVLTSRRDQLAEQLKRRGIGTAVHYPAPLHDQDALGEYRLHSADRPHAAEAAESILSLPMFVGLGDEAVREVCAAVRRFFGES
jgi:dTDP-4-amino-4,6-dideoxygalactose transaminase